MFYGSLTTTRSENGVKLSIDKHVRQQNKDHEGWKNGKVEYSQRVTSINVLQQLDNYGGQER